MKCRFAITLCIYLLLGAAVNVAVAWGFQWAALKKSPRMMSESFAYQLNEVTSQEPNERAPFGSMRNWEEQTGAPLLSLRRTFGDDEFIPRYFPMPNSTLTFTPSITDHMPTDPITSGFAINTFFYAAILWLLFAFPFTLRRRRRIRRGLCAKCAYPVGASDVCTECGAAIRRPSGAKGCSHG